MAKKAVELGDPNEFVKLMAAIDPDKPIDIAPASPGGALLKEAEQAFTRGDFDAAFAKYAAAADADPRLYEAPLYAGDTALHQKDLKTAARWFARAIEIDPDRETAYRYWGDAMIKLAGTRRLPGRSSSTPSSPSLTTSWPGRDCANGRRSIRPS